VVPTHYQGKHGSSGGGKAQGGGKVALIAPPLVLLRIQRWPGRSSARLIMAVSLSRALPGVRRAGIADARHAAPV